MWLSLCVPVGSPLCAVAEGRNKKRHAMGSPKASRWENPLLLRKLTNSDLDCHASRCVPYGIGSR